METNSLCDSLLKWLETFPGREGIAVPQLTDGVVMANVLHRIAPEYFSQFWLAKIKTDVGENWRLKVSNLRKVQQGIVDYYQEQLNQNIKHFPLPDLNKIGEHDDQEELGRMLQLILGCAVNCESKQEYIEAIMNMEEMVQKVIMEAIQELMLRESSPGIVVGDGEGRLELGPASFHPQLKTVLEQLETATQSRDETIQRCHELEQQIAVIGEEKGALSTENEKLLNRLDALETGIDLGGSSTLRYKDLKKQIDGLQDELYKLETSRDEYRTKAEVLERENQEVQTRNEELQQLADEARSLKDEVDALREMSERAVVYEGTMETYKKKLEELSDLKRQVRILEEKNSDYMQHNMELEEEVKKSGTWRPQLELYKKQVSDLHQKLAEESKKTDRYIFENKKLTEKMEAIIQEKDRLTMERDGLKENIEELRCHVSTLTSPDTTSRPPSDLSDVDLLEIVPHEIRQRLIRLQHENTLLKQRAGEGDSSEQLPVLQTLVSDLQERQTSLTQENRWECKGDFSQPLPSPGGWSANATTIPSFSFFDACFSVDPKRNLKVFKKNLKWASESDLLILRQPKGLLSANFLSSTLPLGQQPRSLPPMPVTSSSFATQTSKESPIVIRHIHEFKLSPSPTNEDSGCCRTSPSSCEGCDENGCTEDHSPDYVGTLDSGVSGVYSGTLESGISGVYRCLSPVIPSIVEECTTHHMSDIIPALGGQRSSSPPIMRHSHPAHTSCLHCCFQNSSQDVSKEMNGNGTASGRVSSPCPPRPHTVCSYNPPYKYCQATSPLPTTPLPNLPVSPPVSPLPNTPLAPLSFCLPSSVFEVSTIQAVPGVLSCTKTTEEVITSCTLPAPSSAASLTSLTYSTTSPIPVSVSQNRKPCSGLSRPLIPPDSPTPHNSPRLPNSINATRSRACKSPPATAVMSEMALDPIDLPISQTILVGNVSIMKKDQTNTEKSAPLEENHNQSGKKSGTSPVAAPHKFQEQLENGDSNESSASLSSSGNTPTQDSYKSKPDLYKHLYTSSKVLPSVLKKPPAVQELNQKDDFPRMSPAKAAFFQIPHGTLAKSGSEESSQSLTGSAKSPKRTAIVPGVTQSNKVCNSNRSLYNGITKTTSSSKPLVNGCKDDVSAPSQSLRKYSPGWKTNGLPTSSSKTNGLPTLSMTNGLPTLSSKTIGLSSSSSKTNGLPSSSSKTNGLPSSSLKTNGLPSSSLKTNGLPSSSLKTNGLPSSPLKTSGLPTSSSKTNGLPTSSSKMNGLPTSSSKMNGLPTSSSKTNGLPTSLSKKNGLPASSPMSSPVNSSTLPSTSASALVIKNEYISKNSAKNSPIISKLRRDSSLQGKPSNHVKFREPVVSDAIQGKYETAPSHYSPASPRERMSSPSPKAALNKGESPSSAKKNPNGITLLSDTLFTHFVVSDAMRKGHERDVASATDTDTDLETLERKLTMGMYAAPLVSSESCTSVSPDDGDGDPSATEYCSDAEEYNPNQYKAFAEENGDAKSSSQGLLVDKPVNKIRNSKFLNSKAMDAATLVRTYSFFRKQAKTKKQRKNSFKEIVPTTTSGGIVKTKNKTAKHMVAETFNAMFTLCTP